MDKHLNDIVTQLENGEARHVVVDFHHVDRCSSGAIAFFVTLDNKAREVGGRMGLCNLSEFMRIKLEVLHLDSMWPFCDTRLEALATVCRV
jgi:anti-anti-sigma regulatory factor